MPSAYGNTFNCFLPIFIPLGTIFVLCITSCNNKLINIGDKGSPCFRPVLFSKKYDNVPSILTYVILYFNNSFLSDNNSRSLLKSNIMYFISFQASYFQHTVFKFITNSSTLYVSHYKNLNTTWFLQWWPQWKVDSQQAASYAGQLLDFITTYLYLKCFIDTFKLAMYSSKPHSGKDYLYNQHSSLNIK